MHWTQTRVGRTGSGRKAQPLGRMQEKRAEGLCVLGVLLGVYSSGISEGLNFGDCTACRFGRIGRGEFICLRGKVSKKENRIYCKDRQAIGAFRH